MFSGIHDIEFRIYADEPILLCFIYKSNFKKGGVKIKFNVNSKFVVISTVFACLLDSIRKLECFIA